MVRGGREMNFHADTRELVERLNIRIMGDTLEGKDTRRLQEKWDCLHKLNRKRDVMDNVREHIKVLSNRKNMETLWESFIVENWEGLRKGGVR